MPGRYKVLGTDGFGRSDYRRRLRSFFEVDRYHVAVASLKALADEQLLPSQARGRGDREIRHRPGGAEPGAKLNVRRPIQSLSLRRAPVAKIDVNVPDIGDFKDVPVIEVLVKPGDVVKAEQSLVTLESDKATMDVPSPIAGAVAEVVAKVGDKVSMGTLIARIDLRRSERRARRRRPPRPPRPRPRPPAAPAKAAAAPRLAQGGDDRRHGP